MKIYFLSLFFLGLALISPCKAQFSGGGNGNGQPNSQVQNGGLPMQTVVKVLQVAKDDLNESLGTLISGYCSGSCKVNKIGVTSLGDGVYRVEYGGGVSIIVIDDDF